MDIFKLDNTKQRIVLIGGGFGGIEFAKKIDTKKFDVLLLDKHNYFTFQPLLYQVATGGLEPDSIAYPIRKIFKRGKGILFRIAEINSVDSEKKILETSIGRIPYNILVIATGSMTNFFGMEETAKNSLSLKSVTDALDIRSFILQNFEQALLELDDEKRKSLMNIVIIGGGPTGVEIAGSLAELKKHVLPHDYPELDISKMQITIVEGTNKVLGAMSERSSGNALRQLQELNVHLLLNVQLKNYDGEIVSLQDGTQIRSRAVIWTAGVKGNFPRGFDGSKIVRGNRLEVDTFNKLSGTENIFVIGDAASMTGTGGAHPMLAPVAIQQASNLAKNFNRNKRDDWKAFRYFDKGTMATVGRSRAVVDVKFLHLKGFIAWIAWLFIHLMLLVGFRNRVIVFINWMWNYFSYDRAIRLIIRPFSRKQ